MDCVLVLFHTLYWGAILNVRSLKQHAVLVLSIDEEQGISGRDKGAEFIKALIQFVMFFILTMPTQSGTKYMVLKFPKHTWITEISPIKL